MTQQKNLQLVQMLRGIASILVVLYHMTSNFTNVFNQSFLNNTFEFGGNGVDIFFVLSGFIIAFANRDFVAQPGKVMVFLKRRFIRIYPIYWIVITGFLLIQLALPAYYNAHFGFNISNVLSTYLLLPGHMMVNGVSWSLTNELFFYLLFTIAILIPIKKISFYLLLIYFLLLLVMMFTGAETGANDAYAALLFFPMNIEFLLGVFIALIVEKIPKILTWPILLVGTALFLTGAYIYNHEPHNSIGNMSHLFNRVTLFGFSSFLIVLALVKMELNKSMRVNNILLYLGDASYSIYLIHLPLVVAFYKILSRSGVQNEYLLFILNLLLFAVVCFAGIIIYLKIEKPLIRKLNQRLLRK